METPNIGITLLKLAKEKFQCVRIAYHAWQNLSRFNVCQKTFSCPYLTFLTSLTLQQC